MASHAAQSTTAPTVISVLADLKTTPDLASAMAAYLASPSTPAPVRRFIRSILDSADRFASTTAVSL